MQLRDYCRIHIQVFRQHAIWRALSAIEIKSRYRGSVLGPFWSVFNVLVLILALSLIYGTVLRQDLSVYVPYVAAGLTIWWFIANTLNDCCQVLTQRRDVIKNLPIEPGIFIMQAISKNLLLLFYQYLFVFPLLIYYDAIAWKQLVFLPLSIFTLVVCLYFWGCFLAVVSVRFRDVPQLVAVLTQIAIFVTPIIFLESMLGRHVFFAEVNPFYHAVCVWRSILLGDDQVLFSFGFMAVLIVTGVFANFFAERKLKNFVPVWV